MKRRPLGFLSILLLTAAVSCGTNTGSNSPPAIDGILLRASDLPSMRVTNENPADVDVFAQILGNGEIFKDDPPVAAGKLKGFGFKRAYLEAWSGAGLQGGAFVAEFDSQDHAQAALDYMKVELFRPCPKEPTCSNRVEVKDATVPNLVAQALTPLRPAAEGRQYTLYKFAFRIGTLIYGVKDGGENGYDPGSVSQAQATAFAERLYSRVKSTSPDAAFQGTPPSPLGPPPPGP